MESILLSEPGILAVRANELSSSILLRYDPTRLTRAQVVQAVRKALVSRRRQIGPVQAPQKQAALEKPWHRLTPQAALQALQSKASRGLSTQDAKNRIQRVGPNLLPVLPGRSAAEVFNKQFASLPVGLLIGSAGISLLTGGLADAVVILGVVAINGYLGFLTEYSAEKTIRSLTRERGDIAWVLRDGERRQIKASGVVPGDVLLLSPGITASADARVIDSSGLSIDEAVLSGESLPVSKSSRELRSARCPLGECENLVFRGTSVTGGSGRAVVFATGAKTEIGKIQIMMGESAEPETPLQRQLRHLGNQMILYSLLFSGAVFFIGMLRRYPLTHLLKTSISLAIAAIPESLPTIATTTLAQGVRTLDEQGVLVRHLDALETLAGVDVICLDKTGTLTSNEMSVVSITTSSRHFQAIEGELMLNSRWVDASEFPTLENLLKTVALCNEAELEQALGSATELALLRTAQDGGQNVAALRRANPVVQTVYRSEERSYMATVHRSPDGRSLVAVKGRPDEVLNLCRFASVRGKRVPLNERLKREILKKNEKFSSQGLRVLGVAMREGSRSLSELTWLGLVSLADPIRPGTREWIRKMHEAKVRTIMITGDQARTALHIGEALGLSGDEKLRHLSAKELLKLPSQARLKAARKTHIFSRVSPGQKLDIVQGLRQAGQVVAMIGDGVNDGPALKAADVGIAMGGRGEKAASKAADLVLWRDELEQVTRALREGRRTQDDIKKAVDYILTQNLTEMLFTLASVALGLGEPLTPMQLLWINLVTDIFPELALALEPPEKGLLRRHPSHAKDRLLNSEDFAKMALEASILTSGVLGSYIFARRSHGPGSVAQTSAFTTLISGSLLYTWSARSKSSVFFSGRRLPENGLISLAVGAGFAAEGVAIFVPLLRGLLGTERLSFGDLLMNGVLSVAPVFAIEVIKQARPESAPGMAA